MATSWLQTHLKLFNNAVFACSFCQCIEIPSYNEIVGCLLLIIYVLKWSFLVLNFNGAGGQSEWSLSCPSVMDQPYLELGVTQTSMALLSACQNNRKDNTNHLPKCIPKEIFFVISENRQI